MLRYPTPPWPLEEREAAIAGFREVAGRGRVFAVDMARAIQRVKETGAHWKAGAASIPEFAERNGMSAWEGRTYENLARAIERWPEVEALVLAGAMTVAGAAVLGAVSRMPAAFFRPDDRWVEWAQKEDVRLFRRRFEKRRDEHHAGRPVHTIVANVTPEARDDLSRGQVLMSRDARRVVGVGHVIGVAMSAWLRTNDPLLVKPGVRRVPHTSLVPGSRYVPSEVDRRIRVRDDDRCIVPFCTQPFFVEKAHLVAHADVGDREATNLVVLCSFHNWLQLMGDIAIVGTADDPIVVDRNGEPLGERLRFDLACDGRPSRTPGESKPSPDAALAAFLGEPLRPPSESGPADVPAERVAGPPARSRSDERDEIDEGYDPIWLASLSGSGPEPPEPGAPEVAGDSGEVEGRESEPEPGLEDGAEPRAPP